jgi:hypothetical protein
MFAFLKNKHRALWIGALALVLLPIVFQAIGLTLDAAAVVVILAVAAMGLNLLVGYTGLVSFGHSAWFGIGGYAAALAQLHWFKNQMLLPMLFSVLFTATLSLVIGFLILRRRGRTWRHRARELRSDRSQQPFELLRVRGADRLRGAVRAAPRAALALRARSGGDS